MFFVDILKVKEKNSSIRSRIQSHWSEARIRGSESGSIPKCHGSTTLVIRSRFAPGHFNHAPNSPFYWKIGSLSYFLLRQAPSKPLRKGKTRGGGDTLEPRNRSSSPANSSTSGYSSPSAGLQSKVKGIKGKSKNLRSHYCS